ncbi:hypothetical protein JCM10296v2_003815 [Rhodotorula toruloides]
MDCPKAASLISLHHRLQAWLPSRIVYDPSLAFGLDTTLQDTVARAEAAATLVGRETDIVTDETATQIHTLLRTAGDGPLDYRELPVQLAFSNVVQAVLPLVKPVHDLVEVQAPPPLAVFTPTYIPTVPVEPNAVPGDKFFGRELRLEADILVRDPKKDPKRLADHGIRLSMEVKTPEAQRPPRDGRDGGIHRRIQTSLEQNPDFPIDQVETAIPGKPVSILPELSCSSYMAIISPFHPIVPGPASRTPSVARVILATLCPLAVDCDQAIRVWLPVAVKPVAADQPTSAALSSA